MGGGGASSPAFPRTSGFSPGVSWACAGLAGELEDGGVVNEPIDGGHGRHGVLEDLVPLGEDQVGGDDDGFVFVALGEELEEDFHLLAGLLDVADVVDDDGVEAMEPGDHLGKLEVALWRPAVGRPA